MIRGEIAGDCRQLNPRDRAAFQHWMFVNTVVGAVAVMALIAVTSVGYGGKSGSRTVQNTQALPSAMPTNSQSRLNGINPPRR
jgi:hypothetical protein